MLKSVTVQESLWSKAFIFLAVSNALLFSGFHILIPTLPLFIASFGGTDSQVGLIMGSFTFSAVLIRFYTAAGIKRLGKKIFLLGGIGICLMASAGYFWSTSVGLALAIRVLHGIGFGIATTMYTTLIADIIPVARRGEGMGYFGLGSTLLMALAPAVGVWVVESHGFAPMFMVAAGSQLLALFWTWVVKVPVSQPAESPAAQSGADWLWNVKVLFPAFLSLLFGISIGGVLGFVTLLAGEVHIANAGYFFLIATTNVFFVRLVVGKVFDRKGPAWVIIPGAATLLLGLVLLANVSSPAVFLWAAVCYGLGIGCLFPALQTWMINTVVPARRSSASATFLNALDAGVGGGAILFGLVAEQSGYQAIYLYSANVVGCFIILYVLYAVRQTRQQLAKSL